MPPVACIAAADAVARKQDLRQIAARHPCSDHRLFGALANISLATVQAAAVLKNYDAHATVLRRLLLKAATLMPEPAVGFVLENVRNEYGNGNYADNHQFQLRDVATRAGVGEQVWNAASIRPGIGEFIKIASSYYNLACRTDADGMIPAAVAAGAITATELLAIKEFQYLQIAFTKFGLAEHVWFDHVAIEAEHGDESLLLAMHFAERQDAWQSVLYGLRGVLDANLNLYDGLLEALETAT